MKGTLYLLPNTLGKVETRDTIPARVEELVKDLRVFIVEDLRNARRYLKRLNGEVVIDRLRFHELNKHTDPRVIPAYLKEALEGEDTAILSEAGVPGIADPGARIVRLAHEMGIRVIPLSGPSSIVLSLIASGLNGQSFSFHGYLPLKSPQRKKKIKELEQKVARTGDTQIFIETPYRNDAMLKDILNVCNPSTLLCLAVDISLDSEFIRTRTVAEWKRQIPSLHKRPAVFLLGS